MTSHVVPPVPRWLGTPVERAFGTVARLRGARGLHPQGVAFEGQAEVHPAGVVLAPTGDAEVVVRLSRGIGVPHPAPDFNGVAVRFVDAHGSGRHQDVLLTTSFSPPVLRRAIFPWPTFSVLGCSSVLTFDTEEGPRMLRLEPIDAATLADAQQRLPLRAELRIAEPRGPWQPAATITLRRVLDPDEAACVRFDPWTSTDTFRPRGLLNRLRAPAYEGSRRSAPHVA